MLPMSMFRSGYAARRGELLQERQGEQGGLGRLHQNHQKEHKPERRGCCHHGRLKGMSFLIHLPNIWFGIWKPCALCRSLEFTSSSCFHHVVVKLYLQYLFQNHNTEQNHHCEMFRLNVLWCLGGGQPTEDPDLVSDQRNEEYDWGQENSTNLQDERQT